MVSRGGQGPETTFRHTMPTASLLERLNNIPTDQTDEGADSAAADSASTWLFDRTPQAQAPAGDVVDEEDTRLWMRRGGGTGQRRFDLVGEDAVGSELVGELVGVDAYAAPDEAEQRLQ